MQTEHYNSNSSRDALTGILQDTTVPRTNRAKKTTMPRNYRVKYKCAKKQPGQKTRAIKKPRQETTVQKINVPKNNRAKKKL